jgi:glycosyltransferase involved in cell wall biosynthesis
MLRRSKICLNAMVANESRTILRMLESCYQYVDYWVIQDNGSTDGTQDLIRNFFNEKQIPGFLYETKWEYPGWNRDHTLQTCLKSDHGCDWILRMDADEQLVVDADFDWNILNDHSIQSFNITADGGGSVYFRTWLWNARLPWSFKHDKRHEVILLPGSGANDEGFQRVNLPRSFRHIITNDGQTWASPTKFLKDALELESDQVTSGKVLEDTYHLWYIGKSYSDCYEDSDNFPFKRAHSIEYARRAIFYFEQYLNVMHDWENKKTGHFQNEMSYLGMCLIANAYRFMEDKETALFYLANAEQFCPERNEHLMWMAEIFLSMGDYDSMLGCTRRLTDLARKNPFPNRCFLLTNSAYPDTGTYVHDLHKIANHKNEIVDVIPTEDIQPNKVLTSAQGPSFLK